MRKLFGTVFVGIALLVPTITSAVGQVVVQVEPHRYYDRDHRDYHNWDDHEDHAYRAWVAERHRTYVEWERVPPRDQRAYWRWRHQHSDAVLNVNVR